MSNNPTKSNSPALAIMFLLAFLGLVALSLFIELPQVRDLQRRVGQLEVERCREK